MYRRDELDADERRRRSSAATITLEPSYDRRDTLHGRFDDVRNGIGHGHRRRMMRRVPPLLVTVTDTPSGGLSDQPTMASTINVTSLPTMVTRWLGGNLTELSTDVRFSDVGSLDVTTRSSWCPMRQRITADLHVPVGIHVAGRDLTFSPTASSRGDSPANGLSHASRR